MENFKPLTQEETLGLLVQAKAGSDDAKERLIQGNFPLIKSVVKKYVGKGVDYDDLYQIGFLGFLLKLKKQNQIRKKKAFVTLHSFQQVLVFKIMKIGKMF